MRLIRVTSLKRRPGGAGPKGGYREPGDEEGLPGPDDGTSSVEMGYKQEPGA